MMVCFSRRQRAAVRVVGPWNVSLAVTPSVNLWLFSIPCSPRWRNVIGGIENTCWRLQTGAQISGCGRGWWLHLRQVLVVLPPPGRGGAASTRSRWCLHLHQVWVVPPPPVGLGGTPYQHYYCTGLDQLWRWSSPSPQAQQYPDMNPYPDLHQYMDMDQSPVINPYPDIDHIKLLINIQLWINIQMSIHIQR